MNMKHEVSQSRQRGAIYLPDDIKNYIFMDEKTNILNWIECVCFPCQRQRGLLIILWSSALDFHEFLF